MLLKEVLICVLRIIVSDTDPQQDNLKKQGWVQIISVLEQLKEFTAKSNFTNILDRKFIEFITSHDLILAR